MAQANPDRRLEFQVEAEKNDAYSLECEEAIAILIKERSSGRPSLRRPMSPGFTIHSLQNVEALLDFRPASCDMME
jgi:hypothetical protein